MYILNSPQAASQALNFIANLPTDLKTPWAVEVKEYKSTRSQAQNKLLWRWYGIIAKDVGLSPEDLHEQMKARVLGYVEVDVPPRLHGFMGATRRIAIPKSTTRLTVQEFTEFLQAVEALAEELGIRLPRMSDYQYAMYGERVS